MVYLVINGWQDTKTSSPVSRVQVIRRHTGMGLSEAKSLLDRFAEDGRVEVGLPTVEARRDCLLELRAIGVVAQEVG